MVNPFVEQQSVASGFYAVGKQMQSGHAPIDGHSSIPANLRHLRFHSLQMKLHRPGGNF